MDAEVTEIYSDKTSDMNSKDRMPLLPKTKEQHLEDGKVKLKPHSINRIIIKM